MFQNKLNILFLVFFGTISGICNAQSWEHIDRVLYEQLTDEARKLFESENYEYKVSYLSYIGHQSKQAHDEDKGHIIRHGREYFANIPGNKSAQGKGLRIMMDDEEKLIVLLDPDYKLDQTVAKAFYESMFDHADSLLSRTAGSDKLIRFYYGEKSEFLCQEIRLNQKGLPSEMTIYYRDKIALNAEDKTSPKEKPKLVILLKDVKETTSFPSEYKIDSFLKKTPNGYKGVGNYTGYQVVDYRY